VKFKGKMVAFALMLVFAASVYAGDVDDCRSTVGIFGCTQMQLNICPAGDFEFIRDACGAGITAYIWVTARDAGGNPIPGIPWTDYWLNSCDPAKQLYLCASPFAADSLTGENGRTTFSGPIAGGGCTLTQGIWWAIQGKVLKAPPDCLTNVCLNVIVKSPDLPGGLGGKPNGIINLADLIPFGNSYNKDPDDAGYNACCDYNDDNTCNVRDLIYLSNHWQHDCY
jgi:hypothetical protein